MRRPLFYPLLALIAGIWIGDYVTIDYSVLAFTSLIILIALIICIRIKRLYVAFSLIFLLFFIAGAFSVSRYHHLQSDEHHVMHFISDEKLTLEGVVLSEEQISPDKTLLLVECVRLISDQAYSKLSGKIRLVIPADLSFDHGDFIRFRSSVKLISGFHNPGGFDYQRYLNRQGIFVSGFISGSRDIILIRQHWINTLPAFIDRFRLYLKSIIYLNANTPEREIIEAMTIGNQKAIPREIQDAFSQTGTSHILSISGLHVGLVATGGFFLIFTLLKSSEYLMLRFNIFKLAAAFALIPVVIYTLVAGMGTPVLRSAFMALSFLIALMIEKPRDLFNVLFGAALIILMIIPESLFEVSFQLSFVAVFALIHIVPKFDKPEFSFLTDTPRWIQYLFRQIYLFFLVSIAATLGTLPIIVYYFNRISTVTVIANLIAVPLLGMLALLFILLFILAAVFSPLLAGWLIKAASFLTFISIEIIKQIASLPFSSISLVKPGWMEIILLYIILIGLIEMSTPSGMKKETQLISRHPVLIKTIFLASVALFLFNGVYFHLIEKASTDLKLTAIDVGQGSSTLIEFPGGTRMLVDGGGFPDSTFDIGQSVIAPFLYFKRIKKIDIIVLTHPHPDHMQGLIHILKYFEVREVWTTEEKSDGDLYRLWEKTLKESGIKIRYVSSDTPPQILSGSKIEFLWPDRMSESFNHLDANDRSLVLKISFGDKHFLITGDISSRVESILIKSVKNLKSDLLFVPHHGSGRSSSEAFVRKVSSQYAIISAGKNNVFRHPHPDILTRYMTYGAAIFRTDRQGALSVRSDGKKIKITPFQN